MKRIETIAAMREAAGAALARATPVALVPTMGALHEGHLHLVDHARAHAGLVVMSVFVNPLQFGPTDDLARYPRDLERDAGLAAGRGVDLLFAPSVQEMYPGGSSGVLIAAPGLRERLCGTYRPGHFDGVLTVVAKLLHIVAPDVAVFGQKDFQQAVLIRRMVQDLDFPVHIEVAPIVREADGLAMSSRNVYLAPDERARAAALHRALRVAQAAFATGEGDADALRRTARDVLDAEGGIEVQYLEVVDATTLESVTRAEAGNVVALAAHVGTTRLIDNLILE